MKPFDKNETIAKWKQDYPQMPDLFHQAVTEELRRHFEADDLSAPGDQALSGCQNDNAPQSGHSPGNMPAPLPHTGVSSSRRVISETGRGGKKRLSRLLLLPAAAILLGLTALAGSDLWHPQSRSQAETELELAADFQLCRAFPQQLNTREAAAAIQADPEVTVLDTPPEYAMADLPESYTSLPDAGNAPLIDVKEVLYDGEQLFTYIEMTEAGKEYALVMDSLVINETPDISEYFHSSIYTDSSVVPRYPTAQEDLCCFPDKTAFCTYFSHPMTQDFQITLAISPYRPVPHVSADAPAKERWEKCQNQYLTFTVKVPQPSVSIPYQCFQYEEFNMELLDLSYSVSSHLTGTVRLSMTEEQLASYLEVPSPGRHFSLLLAPEGPLSSDETAVSSSSAYISSYGELLSVSMGTIAEGYEWNIDRIIPDGDDTIIFRILEKTLWFGNTVKEETLYGEDAVELTNH